MELELMTYGEAKRKNMLKYVQAPQDYNSASLIKYSKNVYSQNGEDGILEEIFKRLSIEKGVACEFGAWDGIHLSNAFNLVNKGWKCLMIEPDPEKFKNLLETCKHTPGIIPVNEIVSYEKNKGMLLEDILESFEFKKDFDLISIDVDSCDYQIWDSLKKYKPKIVVIEQNGLDMNVIHHPNAIYRIHLGGTTGFPPMKNLGESKGYDLLCNTGNLIFSRKDITSKIIKREK